MIVRSQAQSRDVRERKHSSSQCFQWNEDQCFYFKKKSTTVTKLSNIFKDTITTLPNLLPRLDKEA